MMGDVKIDVVVDLETLDRCRKAVVTSVGCVAINRKTGNEIAHFHDQICIEQSKKKGFVTEQETIDWWEKQSADARLELTGTKQPREVILYLIDWFHRLAERGEVFVWGNGLKFDLGKLEYHFEVLEYDKPWGDFNDRDIRTAVDLGRMLGIDPKKDLVFEGVKHNALDDARHEAKYLYSIFNSIREASNDSGK